MVFGSGGLFNALLNLFALDMSDPLAFGRRQCERIVNECGTAAETLTKLAANITSSR